MVALSCGSALFVIHPFQDGVFAEFVFDIQNGALHLAAAFQFFSVYQKMILMICFGCHVIAGYVDAVDTAAGTDNPFVELRYGRNEELVSMSKVVVPWADGTFRRLE